MSGRDLMEMTQQACSPGGASVLTIISELAPAAGSHGAVAPARYVAGNQGTYAFETRYIDGAAQDTVLIDSKGSQLNRVEAAMVQAIRDGHPQLSRTPRIVVDYPTGSYSCLELPHRFTDGHVRAGTVDGKPVTEHRIYRAARDATPLNARPLLELSPFSLVGGAWDSTRASHQARYRSALTGEVIGILADQSDTGRQIPRRGGARSDQIAPSVRLAAADLEELLSAQEAELSPGNVASIREAIKKAKGGTTSAAALGLGSIPPALNTLGLVACKRIIRSQVLSFSALRQLRFGGPAELDVAGRTLLAALALSGLAHANQELLLRANCDLVEAEAPITTLDLRQGRNTILKPLTPAAADSLLQDAIDAATALGIRWNGQEFHVKGNPLVSAGASAEEAE